MIDHSDDLAAELRALPTEIAPTRDLLPEIEARLRLNHPGRERRQRSSRRFIGRFAKHVATLVAAAAVFAAGVLVGRLSDVVGVRGSPAFGARPASEFAAATEAQRTGTAYIAALAHVVNQVESTAVRKQARESAAATLAGIVRQLEALDGNAPAGTRF